MNKIDNSDAMYLKCMGHVLKVAEEVVKMPCNTKLPKPIADVNIEDTLMLLYAACGIDSAQVEDATAPEYSPETCDATFQWQRENPELYAAVNSLMEIQIRLIDYYKQASGIFDPAPPENMNVKSHPFHPLYKTTEKQMAQEDAVSGQDTHGKPHLVYRVMAFPERF